MSQSEKYNWITECAKIINNHNMRERRKRLAISAVIFYLIEKRKRPYTRKEFWINPLFQMRREHGFYNAILPTVSQQISTFRNYFRMNSIQLEELLYKVAPLITKQVLTREPISASERLCMTLRFLASGDSMTSMSYQYLLGLTTVSNIISETCDALWSVLSKHVLPYPLTKEKWLNISKEFEEVWNFNHCIGAIDGKHVVIQCPENAGSSYFNYKNSHSFVLLAVCDANYIFTFVDIGAYGRRSDGGIFRDSFLGQKFRTNEMNVPDPKPFYFEGNSMPYVLVGDEAFPLTEYLMRPFPEKQGLNQDKIIYNYRLSRARRTIENAFGILSSQWRILRRPINCSIETAMKIVQAIVCLHNYIRIQDIGVNEYITENMVDRDGCDGLIEGSWRRNIDINSAF
ncbi:putative nuclease HARBI1 [Nylanderia fulva]|uniref:putative nuclease HARBI1 n=1 Tax=Nylanderia fulva TaxID=613905 RepID=UPI0010FB45F1|nr:putative nuclease HARBI1 [Nylanderia fulva]